MPDVLSLFPARVRIADSQGMATPEFSRAMSALFQRVGGFLGDGGIDVAQQFVQELQASALEMTAQPAVSTEAAAELIVQRVPTEQLHEMVAQAPACCPQVPEMVMQTSGATAVGVDGGSAGQVLYQKSAGVTGFSAVGTAGQALLSGGTGAPTWVNGNVTFNGTTVALGASGTITANTTNAATFNNGGAGAASGTTFDGSAARTISYNTVGASPLAGSTSIVTVGTITTGVWNGTAIANANLANSSVTIGSTSVSLGGTAATVAGLSLTSPTLTGTTTAAAANFSSTVSVSGAFTGAARMQITAAGSNPASGAGLEFYGGSNPQVLGFDRSGAAYLPLDLTGSVVNVNTSSGTAGVFSSTGLVITGAVSPSTRANLPSYTVGTLPAVGTAGGTIYVSNESGGAVPAFSDGANWRRVTDRAIVS